MQASIPYASMLDHASIATEVKVADKIREEEGKTRRSLKWEEFLKKETEEWKETYGGRITESSAESWGDSCDWSKEAFLLWMRAATGS